MATSGFRRAVAGAALLGMVSAAANLPALADGSALFRGRVLASDGVSPTEGAIVTLIDGEAQRTFESAPTDDRGYFRVDSAPAGNYRVVARTDAGAFLAAESVALKSGANPPVALSLKANAQTTATPGSGSTTMEPWLKWVIIGGMAIGALVVTEAITSDESPASPL